MTDAELYCRYNLVGDKGMLDELIEETRAMVIDEFVKALEKHQQANWIDNLEYGITFDDIEEVAKQLKSAK